MEVRGRERAKEKKHGGQQLRVRGVESGGEGTKRRVRLRVREKWT